MVIQWKCVDKMKKLLFLIVLILMHGALWAQTDVSLVVSGEGKDKDEATFNALRSAIEQACGTFISANTTILNDKIVADEVVSLSSGNITSYEYVTETTQPNGNVYVTVKTTVSVDKLITFCESKGMKAELKGAAFAMKIKKMEFDKKAEEKAVENLCKQLKTMLPTLFDYKIDTEQPRLADSYWDIRGDMPEIFNKTSEQLYEVPFTVTAVPNENFTAFFKMFFNTLFEISLTAEKVADYEKINQPVFCIWFAEDDHHIIRRDFCYFFAALDDFKHFNGEDCFKENGYYKIDNYINYDGFDKIRSYLSHKYLSHIIEKGEKEGIFFRSQKSEINIFLLETLFGVNIFRDVFVKDGLFFVNCTGISYIDGTSGYGYNELDISNETNYYWCKDFIPIRFLSTRYQEFAGCYNILMFDYNKGLFREQDRFFGVLQENDRYCYHGKTHYNGLPWLVWTKGVAEMNVVEGIGSFFGPNSLYFRGSLFYTLEEISRISSITVQRMEKVAKEEEDTKQIHGEGEQIDKSTPPGQNKAIYQLYSDTLQQAVNNYNALLKQYPYNYQEDSISYKLPQKLSEHANLLHDTLHVLLEDINIKMEQLKERYKEDSLEYQQQNNLYQQKLGDVNQELLRYPYNISKYIVMDSLPLRFFGKRQELIEELQKKIRALPEKQEEIKHKVRAEVRANHPQKYVSIFFSQAADKKQQADSLYIECRCKYTDRLSFDLAFTDNSLKKCDCRELKYQDLSNLYHSREEFDQSYNKEESAFEHEVSDRRAMWQKIKKLDDMLSSMKQVNMKKALASSKSDIMEIINSISQQRSSYYYSEAVDLIFKYDEKLMKEWGKNGSYFKSKMELYDYYIGEDYDKVLKQRKKE